MQASRGLIADGYTTKAVDTYRDHHLMPAHKTNHPRGNIRDFPPHDEFKIAGMGPYRSDCAAGDRKPGEN